MKLNKIMSGVLSLSIISGAAVPVMANDTLYAQDTTGGIVLADTRGSYPSVQFIEPSSEGGLIITVPNVEEAVTDGQTVSLPSFESTELQQYPVTLSTAGGAKEYSVTADKEWIKFTGDTSGSFNAGVTLGVYVDFNSLKSSESGTVTVTAGEESVTINITAEVIDTASLAEKTYTASNGNIVIDAENYAQKGSAVDSEGRTAEWKELEKYGKWGSTMKMFPTTATFVEDTGNQTSEVIDKNNAPWMEYNICVPEDGEYNIICCFGYSNNLLPDSRLRYGVSVDGGEVTVNNSITDNFGVAGISGEWNRGTKYFGRCAVTKENLTAGEHTLRFMAYEPNVELQRIVLTQEDMLRTDSDWRGFADSFFGPDPTYYKGKAAVQQELVSDTPEDVAMIPGQINAGITELVSAVESRYKIELTGTMSDDAKAEVVIDGGEPVYITRDASTGMFEITTDMEIGGGFHNISIKLTEGTGEIESVVFTSTRKRMNIIDHDFSDESQADLYTTYSEGDGNLSVSDGRIYVKDYSSGWAENNGIKIDITSIMSQAAGLSLYASADVEVTWSGTSRLFVETISPDGMTERTIIAESGDYKNNCVSISGSCDAVPFADGDRAYLCITQYSGQAYFDNIKLWYYPDAVTLFKHTFNNEKDSQASMYEPYEEGAGTVSGGSGTVLKYDKGSSAGEKAGIKIDLTDKFGVDSSMSGSVFGASSFIKPGYSWSSGNSAEMFFEIVGESGTKKVMLCSADNETFAETTELFDSETLLSLGTNWLLKPLSGEAALEIDDGDHVYLCITSSNNPVWYDDITVYRQPGAADLNPDDPEPTDKPYDGEVVNEILLNSGMEDKQDQSSAPYYWDVPVTVNDSDTVRVVPDSDAHSGEMAVLVTDRTSPSSGAQQYVTLENYKTYDIGIWVKSEIADTVNLKVMYDYYTYDTVKSVAVKAGEWTYLYGSYTTRKDGKVTQIIIDTTDSTGDFRIDDAAAAVSEDQIDEPEGIAISEIKYREDGSPYLAITNNSGKDTDINIFAASYDAEGALVRVSKTSVSVKVDGNTAEIGFDANAGDKVFIWDKEMRPLADVMVAE